MTIPEKTTEHHTILKYNLKDEFQIYTMYKLINDDAIVSLQLVELFTNNPLEFFFFLYSSNNAPKDIGSFIEFDQKWNGY